MRIHELDPLLANQIAAGEVVQRPASVVKELIENSIDAGAKHIKLTIMNGGTKLIRITDDGHGIYKDDLPLAISRHATSKIASIHDLEKIRTLGFRGEALASVSSVSRFKLISCPREQELAWEIVVEGRAKEFVLAPRAHPKGTTVEVMDLFFNTPARKKFLRSEKTEFSQIEELIKKILLSRWDLNLTLEHNQRPILNEAAAINDLQKETRVANLCGHDFIANAIKIETSTHDFALNGWISLPIYSRSQPDQQYFYVNGRIVRDKSITHAVKSAYQDVMYQNRFPAFVLFFSLSPDQVDINVHPSKDEVRFRNGKLIHQYVLRSIESALMQIKSENIIAKHTPTSSSSVMNSELSHSQESLLSITEQPSTRSPHLSNHSRNTQQRNFPVQVREEIAFYTKLHDQAEQLVAEDEKMHPDLHRFEPPLGFALAQLQNIYILAENSQGLIIVDMHAAHERILYEKMKLDYERQQLTSQQLLVPVVVKLSAQEMELFKEVNAEMQNLGFLLEELTDDTLVIRQIPALLQTEQVEQIIKDFFADLRQHQTSQRISQTLNQVLGNLACKTAIHARRKLTLSEMNHLLRDIERTQNSSVCNHGRPVWRHFHLDEIDKFFLRGR